MNERVARHRPLPALGGAISSPRSRDCRRGGHPHEKWGEEVIAFVELRGDEEFDCEAIIAFAKDELGPIKAPKRVERVDALPRTNAGKISRAEVRKPFWENAGRTI